MNKGTRNHLRKYLSLIWPLCILLMFLVLIPGQVEGRAFNVKGKVLFEDGDTVDATAITPPSLSNIRKIPGRLVKVIVQIQIFTFSGYTDSKGNFSVSVFGSDNTTVEIRYEIDNYVAHVWADTDCLNERLLGDGGTFNSGTSGDIDIGTVTIHAVYSTIDVGECFLVNDNEIEVSFAAAMNINNVLLIEEDDITKNRDPAETDSIGQVDVEYCDQDWNHYFSDLVLTCGRVDGSPNEDSHGKDYGFVDPTIAHEYGHHLQFSIGNWDMHLLDSSHQQCTEIDSSEADDAEFAFSEGFPDYLGSHIVRNYQGVEISGNGDGICDAGEICTSYMTGDSKDPEHDCPDYSCSTSDSDCLYAVEGHIVDVLWDLADGLGTGEDAWDIVDGKAIKGHQRIIQIFDKELDPGWGYFPVLDAPDLAEFYQAWVGRTGKTSLAEGQPAFDMILNRINIVPGQGTLSSPVAKMAPYGFVEANPNIPGQSEIISAPGGDNDGICETGEFCTAGISSYYYPNSNNLDLKAYWSFSNSWGSMEGPVDIHLGVSNLGPMTMGMTNISGSANQADTASFIATNITYTGGGNGWLSVTLANGNPAQGAVTGGQLRR
ncbi:MAG: hypothetical protein ACMUHX_04415, partial [bacterium]